MFCDFALLEDGGWRLSADDRRALDPTSYNRGVLVALRDYWQSETGPEASYSARALINLHHLALTNPPYDKWAKMARWLEGETGADRILRVYTDITDEHANPPTDVAAPPT